MSNHPATWSAFPGKWKNGEREGYAPGIDRDTYLMAAVLGGLCANGHAPIGSPDQLVARARQIVDCTHEDLTTAFRRRQGSQEGQSAPEEQTKW